MLAIGFDDKIDEQRPRFVAAEIRDGIAVKKCLKSAHRAECEPCHLRELNIKTRANILVSNLQPAAEAAAWVFRSWRIWLIADGA